MSQYHATTTGPKVPSYGFPFPITAGADAVQGQLYSINLTLSATPNTVANVTFPNNIRGFRLYPWTAPVQFAVGSDVPVALNTNAGNPVSTNWGVGGVAYQLDYTVRVLTDGGGAVPPLLKLLSSTANCVVTIDTF